MEPTGGTPDMNGAPGEPARSHLSRIARGSATVFAGNITGRLLKLAWTLALTRGLGRELFGVFSLALSVSRIALQVARLGLPTAIVRFVSRHRALDDPAGLRATVRTGMALSTLGGAVAGGALVAVAPWLAELYGQPGLVAPLRILAAGVFLTAPAVCLLRALQAVREVGPMVAIESVATPGLLAAGYWLALRVHRSPEAAAAVFTGVSAVALIAAAAAVRTRILRATTAEPAAPVLRPLLLFALPLVVMELSQFGIRGLDIVILGDILSAADLGTYAGAMPIATFVGFGLVAVRVVFAPTVSMLHAGNRPEAMRRTVVLSTAVGTTVGMMVFGVIYCFDEPLMALLGREFAAGAPVLLVLAVGYLVNTGAGAVGHLLIMTDRPWLVALDNVIFAALLVAGMLVLVPGGGMLMAAGVAAAVNGGINLVRTVRVWRIHRILPYDAATLSVWAWFGLGLLLAIAIRGASDGMAGRVAAFAAFCAAMAFELVPLTRRALAAMAEHEGGDGLGDPPPDDHGTA